MYDYFGLQAKLGITKHPGGWKATKILLANCKVTPRKQVLVVGCGNGTGAQKIDRYTGCWVTGIDISPEMIAKAKYKSDGSDRFFVGNVEALKYSDDYFDVVIVESVLAFTNKTKALNEIRRVLKPNGYLGMNEVTWLQPPTVFIEDGIKRAIGGIRPESEERWIELLNNAGFLEVHAEVFPFKKWQQFIGQLQMQENIFAIAWRFIKYYVKDREFRRSAHKIIKDARSIPKGFLKYLGYGLFVAHK